MHLENCATDCVSRGYKYGESHANSEDGGELENGCLKKEVRVSYPIKKNDETDSDSDPYIVVAFSKVNPDKLPDDMMELLPAARERLPDDYETPPLPDWLDIEKLKKGQAFGLKYLYGLNYSQTLSLLLLFSSPDGLKPLIFTGKSHTPFLATKRYLSTALMVKSWYETEVWKPSSQGYKNLKRVRSLHLNASNRINSISIDEVHRGSNLEEKLKSCDSRRLCPLASTLQKDFAKNESACPIRVRKQERIYLNQLEMCLTQFGFYGLILLYPEKFAAKNATKEDLSNFAHLWRYVGYMLGIKDEYNLCKGDIDTVIQRSGHIVEYFIKPMILQVNKDWEHMSRCALQGIEKFTKFRINFESTMLYFCWVFDLETPNLVQYVGWKELTLFNMTKFVMTECHRIPGFRRFVNYFIKRNVENAAKEINTTKNNDIE